MERNLYRGAASDHGANRGQNYNEERTMLIMLDKNGPIRLVSDARPSAPPVENISPPEREARYACIRERVDDLCGVERAPLLER